MDASEPSALHRDIGRRSFLKRSSSGLGTALLGGALLSATHRLEADSSTVDLDLLTLNLALNLEYLEAEFYTRATSGVGIADSGVDVSGFGTVGTTTIKSGKTKVHFATAGLKQIAREIAGDERTHVATLRAAIQGTGAQPAAFPPIDLQASFTNLAVAAGLIVQGQTFDPFADEVSFLLGAFIFEDVGVTAYYGGVESLTNRSFLNAAAGLMAVESAHSAIIRQALYNAGGGQAANLIAAVRAALDGTMAGNEVGILTPSGVKIVPTSAAGLVFARATQPVLNIVYGGGSTSGLFFPQGMNLPS